MKELILVFYFVASFMLIFGILFYFVLKNSRVERRFNYYLDINKKYKKLKKGEKKEKIDLTKLKSINKLIGGRLSEQSQNKITQMLQSAGLEIDAEEYVFLRIFAAIFVGLFFWLIAGNILFSIPGGALGYILPKAWVDRKRKKRIQNFNDGLSDMIQTIIGSLRAGYSFPQAMKVVSEESESPIKEEVIILLKELNYGMTMEEGLNNFKQRMPSKDLDIMIQAILIQRQVGGNLSMILEIIVKTIRERNTIERQVDALTAQGRLSGKVIGLLPVIMGLALFMINPEYIGSFTSHIIGKIALGACVVFASIGYFAINKLTKIEV
jgi:tight adherence protein B